MGKVIKIEAGPSGRPGDVNVRLIDTDDATLALDGLGKVQAVQWTASVNSSNKCVIQTIMTPSQIEVLERDTEIKVTVNYRELPIKDLLKLIWYKLRHKKK